MQAAIRSLHLPHFQPHDETLSHCHHLWAVSLGADKRELWKDEELLKVRALPLAVLAYLVQHPGRVIPVEEMRKAIWGDTRVGRGAIRVCVREIRQALGDEATAPHYIETVGRQGYRFIGARHSQLQ